MREDTDLTTDVDKLVRQCEAKLSMCDLVQRFEESATHGEVVARRLAKVVTTRLAKCGVARDSLPAVVQSALGDLNNYLPLAV